MVPWLAPRMAPSGIEKVEWGARAGRKTGSRYVTIVVAGLHRPPPACLSRTWRTRVSKSVDSTIAVPSVTSWMSPERPAPTNRVDGLADTGWL
jgi:hypothetical protein